LCTWKIHFEKDDKPCEIEIISNNDKFELKGKKNGRRNSETDKSEVSLNKLSKNMFTLAADI
jgi:hypothetical protein